MVEATAAEVEVTERCITAKETADLLRLSVRTLDKRATWSPPFPKPINAKPLIWRLADVEAWIVRASKEANAA